MCDSVVAVVDGSVWLAKNSDREPDEVQLVEAHPPADPHGHAVIVSRPQWMWGCEMGVNARGVAVANEAVFTRMPPAARGLTGMDLQRMALGRASTAADALAVITDLLARQPQGGRMGHRDLRMRYSSSFLLADRHEAWQLETAGELWAAQRITGVRAISNALTIEADHDRIHPRAFAVARARGWCRGAADFGFARCFGRRDMRLLAGAEPRRACAQSQLRDGPIDAPRMAAVLRDHAGLHPSHGLRMLMPCAHASWLPTRASGQTTASMIVQLGAAGPRAWFTGTSSPCISIFKPVHFDNPHASLPVAGEAPDAHSLWWRHERLHRVTLADYSERSAAFAAAREALEARAWTVDASDATAVADLWESHRQAIPAWTAAAAAVGRPGHRPFHLWWAHKARAAAPA